MRNCFLLAAAAAAATRWRDGRFLGAGKASERDPSLSFALLGASMTAAADASRRQEFFSLLPDADLHVATKFLKQASDAALCLLPLNRNAPFATGARFPRRASPPSCPPPSPPPPPLLFLGGLPAVAIVSHADPHPDLIITTQTQLYSCTELSPVCLSFRSRRISTSVTLCPMPPSRCRSSPPSSPAAAASSLSPPPPPLMKLPPVLPAPACCAACCCAARAR